MPGSRTYARLEKECEDEIRNLAKSENFFDDPVDSAALPNNTGVHRKVKKGKDDAVTELGRAKKGFEAMAKECHERIAVCKAYEEDLARYEQESAAHQRALDAYANEARAAQTAKPPRPAPTPPPGLRPAPTPPPYWSKD